jgi:predicted transcriptional regulator of viral defense system
MKKGLGRSEVYLLSSLLSKGKTSFTIEEAMEISGYERKNLVNALYKLTKKGWLLRLERGKYQIIPFEAGVPPTYMEHGFILASTLIKPYYIGFWSALNYYGYTEQTPTTIFIATTKRKRKMTVGKIRFKFVYLSKRKFFGYTEEWIGDRKATISDREKTIVDCLDHPELCGGIGEVAKGIWNAGEEISWEKLLDYALKIGNSAVLKRLGYLIELMGIETEKGFIEKLKNGMAKGFVKLDPMVKRKGRFNSRWQLILNMDEDEIFEWMRY